MEIETTPFICVISQCLSTLREKTFFVLICGHWLFSLHRTALRRVCLLLHYSTQWNIYTYWQDPLSCLLFLRLNSPSTVSLPFKADTPTLLSSSLPSIGFVSGCPPSSVYWEPQNWTQNSRCASPKLRRGEESLVTICWQCSSWNTATDAVGCISAWAHCWLMFSMGKRWSQRAGELHPSSRVPAECQDWDCSRL